MKKSLLALSVVALTAFAGAASAGEKSPFYLGGNVGFSSATNISDNISKDDGSSLSVYGGYQFTENLAAEIGYTKLPKFGTESVNDKPDLWTLQAVVSTPVAERVSVFGKAGVAYGKYNVAGQKFDGLSPVVGAGVEYSFTPSLSAVGELSYANKIAGEDAGAVTTSFGLKYRF